MRQARVATFYFKVLFEHGNKIKISVWIQSLQPVTAISSIILTFCMAYWPTSKLRYTMSNTSTNRSVELVLVSLMSFLINGFIVWVIFQCLLIMINWDVLKLDAWMLTLQMWSSQKGNQLSDVMLLQPEVFLSKYFYLVWRFLPLLWVKDASTSQSRGLACFCTVFHLQKL